MTHKANSTWPQHAAIDGHNPIDIISSTESSIGDVNLVATPRSIGHHQSDAGAVNDKAEAGTFASDASGIVALDSSSDSHVGSPSSATAVVDDSSSVDVANGATVDIDGASAQLVTFEGTSGTLKLDDSLAFTGKISGLTGADALDLADVSFGANTTANFAGNASGGILTVTDGTHSANIALAGNYLNSGWTLTSDGHGGTTVVDPPLEISPSSMSGPNSTLTVNGSTFSVGVQGSFSSLTSVMSLANMAGVTIDTTHDQVTISASNLNLANINFQGWNVVVQANNVTFNNCLFDNSGYYALWQKDGYNGMTVENCSFVGDKTANSSQDFVFSEGSANIHNNVFVNATCSAVWTTGGSVSNNYIGGGGYISTAHSDGIYEAYSTAPLTISNNYINWNTPPDAAVQSNNAVVLTSEGGPINDVTINGNIILGGGYTVLIRTNADYAGVAYPITNVTVENNQIGDWGYGPLNTNLGYPPPTSSINWTGNSDFDNGQGVNTMGDTGSPSSPPTGSAPSAPVIASFSADSGVAGDHITNDKTLTLTGTAVANSTVTVYDGAKQIGTATANSSGAWTFATAALADGSHSFTATDTSSGLTSAASAALAVTVDTVAPNAPVESAASVVSGTTEVKLTGTAEANSTVTVYDGTTQVGTATANASGAWTLTTGALASGSHSFTSTATDAAGNVSAASAAQAVTIASAPSAPAAPTIASFSTDSGVAGDHITNDNALTLTGTAVANSTVTVYDGTKQIGTATANSNGAWTFATATLADGSHSFTATDTSSGTTSAASSALAVTVDTVAPNAPVESAASIVSGTTEVKLTGTAEANSTVTVFDGTTQVGTATVNASGAWTLTTGALASGSHSFTSTATDAAGNVSAASAAQAVTISSAPSAPAAPTIASFSTDSGVAGDHITNDSTLTLTGTAVANSTVTVFDGIKQIGTATANSSGAWTFATAALADGSHSFTATDTSSGTTSAASSALAVTVDTIAPSAPVMASDSIVNTNQVLLTGTAEANSAITVYDGTTVVGTATTGANGSWTVTTASLASGPSDLTATATDAAGNVSAISQSLDPVIPGSSSSAPTNLVTNGSFEAGSFSGWTVGGNSGVIAEGPQTLVDNHAESGKFAANIGAMNGDATLSQAIQTTAGEHYTLTFWLANAGGNGANDFTVQWNGATLLSLTNAPAQGYTEYTFDVVGTGGTSQLLISGRNDPSYWSLDAISVTAANAPVAAVPTIAAFSNDSGVAGDHITDDNTLTLTGTALANSTVTVFDGTKQIGTATAGASGGWTFTTAALADGSHSFTATDTNSGTTSAASSALAVTVDTTAPNAPVETASIISGTTQVKLTGTAEANSTVAVFDGTTELGTVTANATGAWTYQTSELANGNHAFTATDTDVAGNTSSASAVATVVVNAPTNLVTNGGFETGSFSGWTVGGNSGVIAEGPQTLVDNHAESGKFAANIGAVNGDATLSQAIQTTAGEHYTLTFWLANAGGNGANDFTVQWNGATLLSLTNAPAQGYTEYTFDVVGTGGTSQLLISGRNDPSYWSLDAISVAPADAQALAATASAAAPAVPEIASFSTDSGVVGDHITNDNTLTLTGSAAANSTVAVYDGTTKLGTTTASSSGSWDYITSILTDAKHLLTATATDASGHTSAASTALSVTVDTHAPAAPVLVNDSVVDTNHELLSGTAEANSTVTVYDGKTVVGTGATDSSGDWSLTTSALSSGSHTFTATATDAAGNVSTMSQPLDPVIPSSAPPAAPSAGSNSGSTLVSTSGNDLLAGTGHSDTFVFAPNFGNDVIKGFVAGGAEHDTIQFSKSVFENFANVLSHASQVGQDVVIATGADTLTLKNTKIGALHSYDFHFS